MSAAEETIKPKAAARVTGKSTLDRVVEFFSSVRFGVTLLVVMVILSMIGMLIVQQNVDGFDSYFASLTPAEKLVFGSLGFFDIYHSWYYNGLLLILSLNIVLASIDRFPTAWAYITKPKLTATRDFLSKQPTNASFTINEPDETTVLEKIRSAFKANGLKPVITESRSTEYGTDESGRKDFSVVKERLQKVVFGQSGKWNRIGAYIVHVALLTLFLGHFVALQTGFDADVRMIPGDENDRIQMIQFDLDKKEKFEVQLPFSIACLDIEQKLIDQRGGIDVSNTLDWRTRIKINDPEYGETVADVALNKPFTYRGYRFFQAQTIPVGNARNITLELTSQADGSAQKVEIPRLGSATLQDGTLVEYEDFQPDFVFGPDGKPDSKTGDYNNPVAVLGVTPAGGERTRVFAFAGNVDNMPVGAPKAGYKWKLAAFEKSPFAHVLSIKYDPYSGAFIAWYFGGFGLMGALVFVFLIPHRRVWVLVEKNSFGSYDVVVGGDTNRNHVAFEEKFNKLVEQIQGVERETDAPLA
jgi:cytochrome c biogenesis protein